MTNKKTIGICHYRIGKTDGVSLEIIKHKKILEGKGHKIVLIAGTRQVGADYIIPELEFDRKDIVKIKENAFFNLKDYDSEDRLLKEVHHFAEIIKDKLLKIDKKEKFGYLFPHNIFSHGRHIATAKAFHDIALKTKIKVFGFNHDFYFAGSYKDLYKPQGPKIRKYLEEYVPPKTKLIKHVSINSINQRKLLEKRSIKSLVLPNVFDFNQKVWKKDSYNKNFLNKFKIGENDLVILQATRISERKNIESSIDLVKSLEENKDKLIGKKLYNGKEIIKKSKFILLLPGFIEPASSSYGKKIKDKIKKNKIRAKFISSHISSDRMKKGNKKIFSLWDAYIYADLVTFPSIWEGWGNQLIEAIFAKKPVVVFEYPVFKKDIKKEKYSLISLGSQVEKDDRTGLYQIPQKNIDKAVKKTIKWLTNQKLNEKLERNFKIGKKYHSYKILEDFFFKKMEIE